jgi:hypothetical protein
VSVQDIGPRQKAQGSIMMSIVSTSICAKIISFCPGTAWIILCMCVGFRVPVHCKSDKQVTRACLCEQRICRRVSGANCSCSSSSWSVLVLHVLITHCQVQFGELCLSMHCHLRLVESLQGNPLEVADYTICHVVPAAYSIDSWLIWSRFEALNVSTYSQHHA